MRVSAVFSVFGLVAMLAGCASDDASPTSASAANDPYESTNRQVFAFNQKVDQYVFLPGAKAYNTVVPEPAREGLHNFLVNLDLPVTFANDVLQGDLNRAGQTLGRFGVNSTIGFGGILDPATAFGMPYHKSDFGITLGTWGVGEGPYLVLPVLGSDPPRDAAGQVVDIFLDPFTYVKIRDHFYWSAGREFFSVLDLRARNIDTVESLERSSIDYYASVRSLYRQNRNNMINKDQPDLNNLPKL
jgi:phospholipid-binding lipoprotein MlaA